MDGEPELQYQDQKQDYDTNAVQVLYVQVGSVAYPPIYNVTIENKTDFLASKVEVPDFVCLPELNPYNGQP